MTSRVSITLAICLAGAIIAGIGLARPSSTPSAPAATAAASTDPGRDTGAALPIEGFAFPETIQVDAGGDILISNRDGVAHTVTAVDGAFDTGLVDGNGSYSLAAPTVPGIYAYFCTIHPSMTGELVVQ